MRRYIFRRIFRFKKAFKISILKMLEIFQKSIDKREIWMYNKNDVGPWRLSPVFFEVLFVKYNLYF